MRTAIQISCQASYPDAPSFSHPAPHSEDWIFRPFLWLTLCSGCQASLGLEWNIYMGTYPRTEDRGTASTRPERSTGLGIDGGHSYLQVEREPSDHAPSRKWHWESLPKVPLLSRVFNSLTRPHRPVSLNILLFSLPQTFRNPATTLSLAHHKSPITICL